jgi:hypothetical protein
MASRARVPYASVDQRRAQGQEALNRTPLSSHRRWAPAVDRPDPVALLGEQNRTREADLVPVRHGRMLVSPFTFYRGAAKIMAADLEGTPTAGLQVQLCGDAHLSNFGAFASPERRLLFDVNDFDETLPGPFEYDVKRLAASLAVAGRNNGFTKADSRAATRASVTAYREAMAGFATMGTMDIWYAHLAKREVSQVLHDAAADSQKTKKGAKAAKRVGKIARKEAAKARTRDSLEALSKLAELVSGQYRIVSQPPIIVPARDLEATYGIPRDDMERLLREQFRAYRATLRDDHRHLLERFQPVDMAASDIYLGWTAAKIPTTHHFYWRQLRDMKRSVGVETMAPTTLAFYARACGWTLARAHARSGDPIAIAAYLGEGDQFDRSITDYVERYADQNEQDYQAFVEAIRSGRLQALQGV